MLKIGNMCFKPVQRSKVSQLSQLQFFFSPPSGKLYQVASKWNPQAARKIKFRVMDGRGDITEDYGDYDFECNIAVPDYSAAFVESCKRGVK